MKALVINNVVMDIEKRDINVFEYYHPLIAEMFVDCDETVEMGDIYENGEFHKRIPEESEEVIQTEMNEEATA